MTAPPAKVASQLTNARTCRGRDQCTECPQGHPLQRSVAQSGKCEECDRWIFSGEHVMACSSCKCSYCSTCSPQAQSKSSFWEDARVTLGGALRDIERAKVQIANEMSMDFEKLRSFFSWKQGFNNEHLGEVFVNDSNSENAKDMVASCCTTACRKPEVHVIVKERTDLDVLFEDTPLIAVPDIVGFDETEQPDSRSEEDLATSNFVVQISPTAAVDQNLRGRTLERSFRGSRRSRTPPASCRSILTKDDRIDGTRAAAVHSEQSSMGLKPTLSTARMRVASRKLQELGMATDQEEEIAVKPGIIKDAAASKAAQQRSDFSRLASHQETANIADSLLAVAQLACTQNSRPSDRRASQQDTPTKTEVDAAKLQVSEFAVDNEVELPEVAGDKDVVAAADRLLGLYPCGLHGLADARAIKAEESSTDSKTTAESEASEASEQDPLEPIIDKMAEAISDNLLCLSEFALAQALYHPDEGFEEELRAE